MTQKQQNPVGPWGASNGERDSQERNPKLQFTLRLIPVVFLLLIGFVIIAGYLQKWLWMRQLDFTGIFWTLFSVQWIMFFVALAFVFLYLGINLLLAVRTSGSIGGNGFPARNGTSFRANILQPSETDFSPRLANWFIVIVCLGLAWFAAAIFSSQWDTYLRFRYGASFGVSDPLFGVDVGFYVFKLPFFQLLQTSLMLLTILVIGMVSNIYVYLWMRRPDRSSTSALDSRAISHLSVLLFVLVAALGCGFLLDHYELVYSTQGVVYGAGFTAVHVTQFALWIMVALSVAGCALLALNIFRPSIRWMIAGASAYVTVYVVGILLVPAIFQKFVVQPSELAFETPYLKRYIDFTRKAYDFGAVEETSYPALADLTPAVLSRNQDTIDNIRLWDERPLLKMYQQTQAIRLYYQFYNVGVDRYHLPDGYHQVMLATRELSPELPEAAQTWVNENLQFTHGYGLVMNYVSKKVGGGFPDYLIENVPSTPTEGLSITQPSIYYGETMPGSRIVGTSTKEFDYPKGNDNVYTSYAGAGGIPLDSFWRRVLFAWTQSDINILLTTYLKPESRIQIWRDVQTRISKIAPFLSLDHDPYPVLSNGNCIGYRMPIRLPINIPMQILIA